jgi:ketosteroid isomerase-like protein
MSAGLLAVLLLSTAAGRPETPATSAPAARGATAEVQAAVDAFVRAFEALDWPTFRACFAEGATVFHPAPPQVLRTDSPETFERAWATVFERIRRESGRTAPPYFTLAPKDVRIQRLSEKVALVTFHLPEKERVGRRTVILEKQKAGWKIVHIHASNLSVPPPSTPEGGTR